MDSDLLRFANLKKTIGLDQPAFKWNHLNADKLID